MAMGLIGIFVLVLMLAILVGGVVMIVASKGKGLGYPSCGACQYDLSGTIGSERRCPECGADFAAAGIVPPKGKRNGGVLAIGIVMIVMSVSCFGMAFVGSIMTVRTATVQQQAIIQQQLATTAAMQAKQAASMAEEIAELMAEVAELQSRQSELQEMPDRSADLEAELEQLPSTISAIEEHIEKVRGELEQLGGADENSSEATTEPDGN